MESSKQRFNGFVFGPVGARQRILRLAACLAIIAFVAIPSLAQNDRTAGFSQRAFALVGGTVIPRPSEILEKTDVLIRDGVITAIGKKLEIPADAEVIDAAGLYVYAGFIDAAATDLVDASRNPKPDAGRKVDFSRYVLAATRPDNRRSMTPEFRAAAALKADAAAREAYRKYGFTSVHVLPKGRVASGQGALTDTSGAPLRESLLLNTTLSELQLFGPGGSAYPSTLMGATAHLRQALLDSRQYRKHNALYAANAPGVGQPPVDATLAALDLLLHQKQRAVFRATTRDDIHRALDVAIEFNLQAVIWGGDAAWRATERLKKQKVDLIVDVNFGNRPKVEAPKQSDKLVADVKPPVRAQRDTLRRWQERVVGLAALSRAGIRLAVGSHNLKNRGDFLKNVRLAIDAGWARDDALAALTLNGAEILGIESRLGTVAVGKLSHLIVMTGPFDNEKAKLRHVFTGVTQVEYNKSAKPVVVKEDSGADIAVIAPLPDPVAKNARPTELEADRLRRPIQTGRNVLIKNGTVLTATGQTLLNTSVLVKDGKIAAIAKELVPHPGMTVIDATGRFVMPGIIDTHSHIMITAGINEATQSIVPEVRIKDVIRTSDVSEFRALAGGVTTARILHGSANVIGGQDAVVKLRYGSTAAEHILQDAPQGVKFALGENVKFRTTRFPNTRLGVEATLNRAFMEAVDYRRRRTEFDRRHSVAADANSLLPPRRDLRLEALSKIVDQQMFIHSHCYRSDEILMLLRVASDLGIRVWSLQHVLEGYKVAPEIAAHGASCSTFADWWAYKVEAFDATPYNAALLQEAGANVVVKSDDWELIRHLYLEAAKTVRYGNMHPDHALQTITRNAARELGLNDRIGTIEVGKEADLAIFNGHPLNAFSRCEMTLIGGEVYFHREKVPSAMSVAGAKGSATPSPLTLPASAERLPAVQMDVAANGKYAIVGATLHVVDGDDISNGTLIIDGGKIADLGADIKPPSDATIISGKGLHVSPGLIDAGTTLGLVEIGKVRETHDYSEGGNYHPDLRAGVAINPDSELLPVARAGGITTVLMRPTGGVIAGQASLVTLAGWTATEMVDEYEQGLQLNWRSDKKVVEDLRQFLAQARQYLKVKSAAEKAKQTLPIADPRYDALQPYLNGQKPVYVEADSRKAIAEALLFAGEEKLRIVITGGTQAWLLADELKKRQVPVIVGPVMRSPVDKFDPFDAPYANPGRLHEAGVKFCIRSNSASNCRNAPFEAAMAVAYGLPPQAGLRAVTLSAAEVLGIDDEVGSLTKGKRANVVISDGSLLQQTTQIKGVLIDGKPFRPESRQTRFYERYRRRLHEYQATEKAENQTATGAK